MFPAEAVVKWHMRRLRKVFNFHSPPLWSDKDEGVSCGCRSTSSDGYIPVNVYNKGFEVPVSAVEEIQVINDITV